MEINLVVSQSWGECGYKDEYKSAHMYQYNRVS